MPKGNRRTKPANLKIEKVEDPVDRLARQQRQQEENVSKYTRKIPSAENREDFPTNLPPNRDSYLGKRGLVIPGSKDRMPGATLAPPVNMNPLEYLLDSLGIQKFQPAPPQTIKPKKGGDYI
jgi:hypothetical protein